MRRVKPTPPANRQPERVRPVETSTAGARATLPVHGPLSLDRESACRNRKDKLPVAVDSAHQLTFPVPAAHPCLPEPARRHGPVDHRSGGTHSFCCITAEPDSLSSVENGIEGNRP